MITFRTNQRRNSRHASRTRKAFRRACTAVGIGAAMLLPMSASPAFAALAEVTFPTSTACPAHQFCYWASEDYPGNAQVLNLDGAATSVCIPLPQEAEARSFVNNRDHEITLYEGGHCSTEGDFRTYPGNGTYVPESPFVVRAVEIWN